jgi:hypothetical protein
MIEATRFDAMTLENAPSTHIGKAKHTAARHLSPALGACMDRPA